MDAAWLVVHSIIFPWLNVGKYIWLSQATMETADSIFPPFLWHGLHVPTNIFQFLYSFLFEILFVSIYWYDVYREAETRKMYAMWLKLISSRQR